MDLRLDGKRAIVTGASEGIGHSVARLLAAEGCAVALVARREDVLEERCREIRDEFGIAAHPVAADLSTLTGCEEAADRAIAALGGLDILVNNAGSSLFATFEDLPDERWLADIELKLMGYVRMTRRALPELRQSEEGRVINVAGNSGKQPLTYHMSGAAANIAVLNFTTSLAMQVAGDRIHVIAVNPGPVATARFQKQVATVAREQGISPEEARARFDAETPLGRVPDPDDVAATIVFLASPRAAGITGTSLTIDGGITRGI